MEPKHFKINRLSLWGLFEDSSGRPYLAEIQRLNNAKSYSFYESVVELSNVADKLQGTHENELILPVYCIGDIDPIIGGVKSFLAPNIPKPLKVDIQSLRLHRPLEIKFSTGKNESGALVNTIIDFSYHKIFIIGNFEKAISQFKTILDVFFFPDKEPKSLSKDLHHIFTTYIPKPAGSKLLIGGFGAIYAFLFAFIVNKCLTLSLSFGELFSFILGLFSIVCFLTLEAFEDNIIAFSSKWVLKYIIAGWYLFLLLLFVSPFLIFGHLNLKSFLPVFGILAIAILFVCFIRTLGSVFFNYGVTKRTVLILWIALALFIILLPAL